MLLWVDLANKLQKRMRQSIRKFGISILR